MPWLETAPVEQRQQFIEDYQEGLYSRSELCARYGISCKTGYKWLERFADGGRRGLADRSRAPHTCPHRISDVVAEHLCQARKKHPDWGPAQRLDWLSARPPEIEWPATSTAGDLHARRGLVVKRRCRRPHQHPGWWRPSPRRGTICGRPTSSDSSPRATASGAIPSRLPFSTHGSSSPVGDSSQPKASASNRSSSAHSASMDCRWPSARTTGCCSPRPELVACHSSTSGGCGSAFSFNASIRDDRNRTARMNACIGR